MAITEQHRHDLYVALEAAIGPEQATTLMEHLPPVGWADVATKQDLDHLRNATASDLELLRTELSGEIGLVRAEITGIRTELSGEIELLRTEITGIRTELSGENGMLRTEITGIRTELSGENGMLRTEITGMRTELGGENGMLRTELENRGETLEAKIDGLAQALRAEFHRDQRNLALAVLGANAGLAATVAALAFAAAKLV